MVDEATGWSDLVQDADLSSQAEGDHDWMTTQTDQHDFDWGQFHQAWQAALDHAA